ncbi:hypothetical protein CcaverHIS002_0113300 [Cutaneotrichosporon cavernicola]|uniref:Uncharacterized protein n=1 Tax=Cutaneotrichosporon cavernicola TaxID=279322 RepID=A0AA48HZV1_9TREE|nr:uncharacterized protein CcaverHIS019_0113170 [Cutaneotrichosporon cavernicola]BEI80801.1 hypothetical protein CcaverHIS002_0113300 [Cutaneotrichosporon cavernicola]BEI88599.1 hypothetical protein CcaverHIS019_0113170 [Cutaneotrichosporon cavernicola]BEI96372.1 hypothetical protein CcaverHIS631_0113210 [Cutaneotrichosporon cavernicola]BEJ04144.1 hypothetical protein CcaverHIS641_0113190 [Cutaneotrichosporon cavernicola]
MYHFSTTLAHVPSPPLPQSPVGLLSLLLVGALILAILLCRDHDTSAREQVHASLAALEYLMVQVCITESARDDELAAYQTAKAHADAEAALLHALIDAPYHHVAALGTFNQKGRPRPTLVANDRCRFPSGASDLVALVDLAFEEAAEEASVQSRSGLMFGVALGVGFALVLVVLAE